MSSALGSRHLMRTLLNVFVSIEMTGASVQFEAKFNYRFGMYRVMAALRDLHVHRRALRALCDEALANIESSEQPLLLRFANLLMNDAVYLLDQILEHMQHLRQTELQPPTGAQEVADARFYAHISRMYNQLGNETTRALENVSAADAAARLFVDPVLLERVAAMLNYFLDHLVGPKKRRELVVHDRDKYEFKPEQLVQSICQLYVNLAAASPSPSPGLSTAESADEGGPGAQEQEAAAVAAPAGAVDDRFCLAILREDRSYSKDLLLEAFHVLQRVRASSCLLNDFGMLAERMRALEESGAAASASSDLTPDADTPDEFVDPIMGKLLVVTSCTVRVVCTTQLHVYINIANIWRITDER